MSGHAYTAELPAPASMTSRRGEPPRASAALWLAAVCAVAMAAVYLVTSQTGAGETHDATLLHHFTSLWSPFLSRWGNHLLHLLEPLRFTLWAIALVCFALARGRRRVALAIAVLMAFAPLSADVLKPLLAHPHVRIGYVGVGPASWPSGHATAALTLAYCAVLAAPHSWRRVVAVLGAVFVVSVGIVLLILAWHMPSDVVGGYLLATLWFALALAWLRAGGRRRARASV